MIDLVTKLDIVSAIPIYYHFRNGATGPCNISQYNLNKLLMEMPTHRLSKINEIWLYNRNDRGYWWFRTNYPKNWWIIIIQLSKTKIKYTNGTFEGNYRIQLRKNFLAQFD